MPSWIEKKVDEEEARKREEEARRLGEEAKGWLRSEEQQKNKVEQEVAKSA